MLGHADAVRQHDCADECVHRLDRFIVAQERVTPSSPAAASATACPGRSGAVGNFRRRRPRAPLPTEAITLVSLRGTVDQRDSRAAAVVATRQALANLPGATLTGMPVLGHD